MSNKNSAIVLTLNGALGAFVGDFLQARVRTSAAKSQESENRGYHPPREHALSKERPSDTGYKKAKQACYTKAVGSVFAAFWPS